MRHALFILVFLSASSPAEGKSYCKDLAQIRASVKGCEDNPAYAVAALDCLEQLEAEIKEKQKQLSSLFSVREQSLKGEQKSSLSASKENYAASVASLALLIGKTKGIVSEVRSYAPEMAFPEDAAVPEVTGLGTEEYLKTESCYADNMEVLNFIVGDLLEHLDDLEATRELASANHSKASEGEADLVSDESLNQKIVGKEKRIDSLPKAKPGKSPAPTSDITGTDRKKKR